MEDEDFGLDGEEQQEEDNRIRQYLSDLNNRTCLLYTSPSPRDRG